MQREATEPLVVVTVIARYGIAVYERVEKRGRDGCCDASAEVSRIGRSVLALVGFFKYILSAFDLSKKVFDPGIDRHCVTVCLRGRLILVLPLSTLGQWSVCCLPSLFLSKEY